MKTEPEILNILWAKMLARKVQVGECWLWPGASTPKGYGITAHWADGKTTNYYVHRIAYEITHSEIPDGLEVDHVRQLGCTNRNCFNPDHLEAVTHLVNVRRSEIATRTVCPRGHSMDDAIRSTRPDGSERRRCRGCTQIHDRTRPPRQRRRVA